MEIERKWLLDSFPQGLEILEECDAEQGYISTKPVVRIRRKTGKDSESFILCFKGEGDLVREEIETAIDSETYYKLKAFIGVPFITKDYKKYKLPTGHKLEVSHVDKGEEHSFLYAEVEFASVEEANNFIAPDFLGEEKTYAQDFSMSGLWNKKLEKYGK